MNVQKLEDFIQELSYTIRSRYPLIYLNSYEESRVLGVMKSLMEKRQSLLYVWSRTEGVIESQKSINDAKDPFQVLKWYEETPPSEKSILVLKDFHPYLKEPSVTRKLRDLSVKMKQLPKNIVFLSPLVQIPAELQKEVAVLDVPLPSREEIHSLIQKALQVLKTPPQFDLDSMIDAAMGLTYDEIENVIAKSIVSLGTLDKKLIRDEKKQIVKKSGLLEFLEPAKDSSKVGGLDLLKQWLTNRKLGFSAKAREIGLPLPKGMLLVGVPGCGKSLTATTVAREWQLPLLRLDLGKVFSGLVGSSESNIRNCIATCEAIAPCILWIDEIEKGLSGSSSSGQTDGGTTSRVFGSLLTWMQEKVSPVFVIATANDISSLPPELLRKGRFDEIFFVDLPTFDERKDIFDIHLERLGWTVEGMDKDVLSQSTEGFSGAEIEQVIISARYEALNTDESLNQKYLLKAISETVPLSKTMNDKLVTLRTWAKHRARQASSTKSDAPSDQFKVRANQLEYICN